MYSKIKRRKLGYSYVNTFYFFNFNSKLRNSEIIAFCSNGIRFDFKLRYCKPILQSKH